MKRIATTPRGNLAALCEAENFSYAQVDGEPYWDESAYYAFTLREIERDLEDATNALIALGLELVDRAVGDERMLVRLGVPRSIHDLVRASWARGDASLYGRFDLAYDGTGPAKLLEFNADTPTSLYESSVFQWLWLEDMRRADTLPFSADQFNGLHEALVERWPLVARPGSRLHLAAMRNVEDEGTIAYLAQTAREAGLATELLSIRDIGLRRGRFVDRADRAIETLFKLYPWEWMLTDDFGQETGALAATRFVEPIWKTILSTKAILPILWDMAPHHPNLLPARFADDMRGADVGTRHVRKLCHSREGANVTIMDGRRVVASTAGTYAGRAVLQALAPIEPFDGNHPVIGAWVVGERACGIGIREDRALITTNRSRFVPHAITD